jgi:hypothetical protein
MAAGASAAGVGGAHSLSSSNRLLEKKQQQKLFMASFQKELWQQQKLSVASVVSAMYCMVLQVRRGEDMLYISLATWP